MRLQFIVILCSCLTLSGCLGNKVKNIPDVSHIDLSLKILRFEKAFFAIDSTQVFSGIEQVKKEFPDFTDFFLEFVLRSPLLEDSLQLERYLRGYLGYPATQDLFSEALSIYPNLNKEEKELTKAMKFFKHYFPERQIPKFVSYLSEYSYGTPVGEGFIGIGLDFFMGEDHQPYLHPKSNLRHQYILRTLNRKHLLPKVLYALADDVTGKPSGTQLINHMINEGKKYFVLDALLPRLPDSLKMGVSGLQIEYCRKYEKDLYKLLVNEKLLYSNKLADFRKFVTMGPFNPQMPAENPGNSGSWLGWQMVSQYMKRHPETSMEQLLKLSDPQLFLNNYRPR